MTTIGENIRRIRKEKNMTQKELGQRLGGITQQQIGQWETGKANPKIETVLKIADALNVEIFDLMAVPFDALDDPQEKSFAIDLTSVEPQDISKYLFATYPQLEKAYKEEQKHKKRAEEMLIAERLETLATHYLQLNEEGQQKALEQVELLTKVPDYRRIIDLFSGVNAAHDINVETTEELNLSLDDSDQEDEQ